MVSLLISSVEYGSIKTKLLQDLLVDKIVYYEIFGDPENAIKREKRLKYYKRKWKIDLIEKSNPEWKDLYGKIAPGSCDQVAG